MDTELDQKIELGLAASATEPQGKELPLPCEMASPLVGGGQTGLTSIGMDGFNDGSVPISIGYYGVRPNPNAVRKAKAWSTVHCSSTAK